MRGKVTGMTSTGNSNILRVGIESYKWGAADRPVEKEREMKSEKDGGKVNSSVPQEGGRAGTQKEGKAERSGGEEGIANDGNRTTERTNERTHLQR